MVYTGRVIDEGIKLDPNAIKAIQDLLYPSKKKERENFLCFASYYREFVQEDSNISGN